MAANKTHGVAAAKEATQTHQRCSPLDDRHMITVNTVATSGTKNATAIHQRLRNPRRLSFKKTDNHHAMTNMITAAAWLRVPALI